MIDFNEWLKKAKSSEDAQKCGMFLIHNGVVRSSSRAELRENGPHKEVIGMDFDYDEEKLKQAIDNAKKMPGIYVVQVHLNRGYLQVGDDLMYVLVGGDIKENVNNCLMSLLKEIKKDCVNEKENYYGGDL